MNIKLARELMKNAAASFPQHYEAAATLADSPDSDVHDLIACLHLGGICAEIAATALYARTNRPRDSQSTSSVKVDAEDWIAYLNENEAK